jgi:hypothetical protein
MKHSTDTHPALAETARALRSVRKRAEDANLARSEVRKKFRRRREDARAAVSTGVTRAQETWIGTRWYARSHPRLVRNAVIAAAAVAVAAVSVALTRED